MSEYYRNHPDHAVDMLNDILWDETATPGELLIVLRQMAHAFGGVQAVAEKAELNPTQMYRTLSADGNPSLSSFTAILKAMGLRLAVKGIGRPETASAVVPKKSQGPRKKPARARTRGPSKATAAR
jgi:DNA-binding phage protein